MSDEIIKRLLLARDETAIAEAERKYGSELRRTAESITHDARDAEECVNDAYLALWRTAPDNVPGSPRAYLTETVKHLAYNRVRSKSAVKRTGAVYELTEYGLGIIDPREPWDELGAAALREAINGFYESLSAEDRMIFVRRHLYSDSYSEIGYRVGKSEKLVSVRLSRMRERMRAYLIEQGVIGMNDYAKKRNRMSAGKTETYVSGGVRCTFTPIKGKYKHILPFSDGRATVIREDDRLGFIDETSRIVIPCEYYSDETCGLIEFMFSEGLAEVMNAEGKFGFIDTDGRTVIPFIYDGDPGCVDYFHNGLVRVRRDGEWMTIDKSGRTVRGEGNDIERDGDFIYYDGDLIGIVRGGKLGYVDREGNTVVPFEYDFIEYSSYGFSEGLATVSKNGKWGFVDAGGREVVEPTLEYESVSKIDRGVAKVWVGNVGNLPALPGESELEHNMRIVAERRRVRRCGLIDKNGREIIPAECTDIVFFSDGDDVCLLEKDGIYSILGADGKVTEMNADVRARWDDISYCSDRTFYVTKDGRRGLIDFEGRELIPPVYDSVVPPSPESRYVLVGKDGKFSICEPFGEPVVPFSFDWIRIAYGDVTTAQKDGVVGIFKVERCE